MHCNHSNHVMNWLTTLSPLSFSDYAPISKIKDAFPRTRSILRMIKSDEGCYLVQCKTVLFYQFMVVKKRKKHTLTEIVSQTQSTQVIVMNTEGVCRESDGVFIRLQWWKYIFTTTLICFQRCSFPLFVQPCAYSVKTLLECFSVIFTSNYLHTKCETTQSSAVSTHLTYFTQYSSRVCSHLYFSSRPKEKIMHLILVCLAFTLPFLTPNLNIQKCILRRNLLNIHINALYCAKFARCMCEHLMVWS